MASSLSAVRVRWINCCCIKSSRSPSRCSFRSPVHANQCHPESKGLVRYIPPRAQPTAVLHGHQGGTQARSAFRVGYARWWLPIVLDKDLVLRNLRRVQHENVIKEFREVYDLARRRPRSPSTVRSRMACRRFKLFRATRNWACCAIR